MWVRVPPLAQVLRVSRYSFQIENLELECGIPHIAYGGVAGTIPSLPTIIRIPRKIRRIYSGIPTRGTEIVEINFQVQCLGLL